MALIPMQGVGQMTPAQQNTIRKAAGGTARASARKRKRSKKAGSVKRAVKRAVKRVAKSAGRKALKKGSAAAKAYMAKLRKMRKK